MSIMNAIEYSLFVERQCHKEIRKGFVGGPKLDATEATLILHLWMREED